MPLKLIFALSLLSGLITSSSYAITLKPDPVINDLSSGYSVLRLLLEDEQHLTTIRRIKAVITFGGISETSTQLIDDIAGLSSTTLEELEIFALHKPAVSFVEFSDDMIGKATLDSLRMTTTKEFLFNTDNFEKNLLVSQAQVLRVISHLAAELAEQEPDVKRKTWLKQVSMQFEGFYVQVYERITLV